MSTLCHLQTQGLEQDCSPLYPLFFFYKVDVTSTDSVVMLCGVDLMSQCPQRVNTPLKVVLVAVVVPAGENSAGSGKRVCWHQTSGRQEV